MTTWEKVLVLNAAYMPCRVISWQRCLILYFTGKVDIVETYEEDICSPSMSMKAPAVVRLKKPFDGMKRGVKFSRVNVLTRDRFTCQYCGEKKKVGQLNYDHVLPRFQGGKTTWENITTACIPCNLKKGNRTPEQANMRLLSIPVKPKSLPLTPPRLNMRGMPEQWVEYCKGFGIIDSDDAPIDSDTKVA